MYYYNRDAKLQEDLERQSYALSEAQRRCKETRAGNAAFQQYTERLARVEEDQRLVRLQSSRHHHCICKHSKLQR